MLRKKTETYKADYSLTQVVLVTLKCLQLFHQACTSTLRTPTCKHMCGYQNAIAFGVKSMRAGSKCPFGQISLLCSAEAS